MAFFKFRWPGHSEKPADKPAKRSRTSAAESVEAMRRRARHRLIGAAVLVLAGVVGFPMLFDTQPRPVPVDIPIEIPDRNKVAPLVVPAPAPEVAAAQPTASTAPESASSGSSAGPRPSPSPRGGAGNGLSDGEEIVASARPPAPRPSVSSVLPPVPKPEPKPEPKPNPKSEIKAPVIAAQPAPAPEPRPARADEAARARALLEGRTGAGTSPVAAVAEDGRFVVQVGAFGDADKAREVRTKVERAGLKTYTQVVDTKDGKRTRVRVGPFANRADADKAAARIKSLELSASVLAL